LVINESYYQMMARSLGNTLLLRVFCKIKIKLAYFFQSRGEFLGSGENVLGERCYSRHRDHDHTHP